jgi:hypothetical protein
MTAGRRGAGRERGEERGGRRECDDALANHDVILPLPRSAPDAFLQPT